MVILFEIIDFAAVKMLLAGIPESVELLVFGIGLIATVMLLRWFLGRGEVEKDDEEFSKRALTK